jgi:TM2 domain-containing membrane protein YozV
LEIEVKQNLLKIFIIVTLGIFLAGSSPLRAETDNPLKSYLLSQTLLAYEEPEVEEFTVQDDMFAPEQQRKSLSKAIFLSLLVPGGGEFYVGSKTKGRIFLGAEAMLWASFFGFRTYGAWAKDDYKSYAAVHAGINLKGKSDDFFEDVNFYTSRDEYNQLARLYQREKAEVYPENDFWDWQWDSPESQHYYRKLRNRSEAAYRKALFMLGLTAANRVLSVIDTIREVRKYNRKIDQEFSSLGLSFDISPFGKNSRFKVTFSKSF